MSRSIPAPQSKKNGDLLATAVIFLLALLPRLYVAIAWAREPVWDGHYYDFGARRIAAGLGYSDDVMIGGKLVWHPWCHYPVGYSGFLGIIYRIFGEGPHVATVANALTGALLAVVTHRLARYATTNPWRGRMAGIFVALNPGLIVYSALLMTEPLAALGIMLAPWLFVRELERDRLLRGAVFAGVVLGLTTLVRPQSLLCALALPLLALPSAKALWPAFKRGIVGAFVASLLALMVVLPWTLRNCRVMDGCALVSTNAGWNLAIGASPRATGRFETLRASDGCKVVTGQVQQDRCWLEQGLHWIVKDPKRWLSLVPKKLSHTFDHESFPMGYLGEADPAGWPEEQKALGRGILSTVHRALLLFAALGLVALPFMSSIWGRVSQALALALALGFGLTGIFDSAHAAWPLAILIPLLAALPLAGRPTRGGVVGYLAFAIASVAVTHAVFFGEDRYHMVITPALCILASLTLRRPNKHENEHENKNENEAEGA